MRKLFFMSITITIKTGVFPDSLCTTINTSQPSTHHEDLIAIEKKHPDTKQQPKTQLKKYMIIAIIPILLIGAYCANKSLNKNESKI